MGKMTGRKLKAQNYFGQKRKNLIVSGFCWTDQNVRT